MLLYRLSPLLTLGIVILLQVVFFVIYPDFLCDCVSQQAFVSLDSVWDLTFGFFYSFPYFFRLFIAGLLVFCVCVQCSRVANLSIFHFTGRTYMPSIVYLLFFITYPNDIIDIPQLMSTYTFSLGLFYGFRSFFLPSGIAVRDIFSLSFFCGLSVLLLPSTLLFVPLFLIFLLFLRNSSPREFFVGISIFFVPFLFYLFVNWVFLVDCFLILESFWSSVLSLPFDPESFLGLYFLSFHSLPLILFTIVSSVTLLLVFCLFLFNRQLFKRRSYYGIVFFALLSIFLVCIFLFQPFLLYRLQLIIFLPLSILYPLYFSVLRKRKVLANSLEFLLILSAVLSLFSPFFL